MPILPMKGILDYHRIIVQNRIIIIMIKLFSILTVHGKSKVYSNIELVTQSSLTSMSYGDLMYENFNYTRVQNVTKLKFSYIIKIS